MKTLLQLSILLTLIAVQFTGLAQSPVHLRKIGSYNTGSFDAGAAEISAYDKHLKRLYVVNGSTGDIDMIDISNPANPFLAGTIDISPWGVGANSVAVNDGIVAAAVENYNKQADGFVVFFDTHGNYKKHVTVGALPDMIIFTPDGKHVLVANEGEPNNEYTVDPLGTVSIIDFPDINGVKQNKVHTLDFTAYNNVPLPAGIKVNGPNATVAQDFEPEYIAITEDSKYAFVTLQENNALAKIDIKKNKILSLIPLGFQDHNVTGFGLDASDQNSGIVDIKTWPVKGLFQPDAIVSFKTKDGEFLATANEGDVRDYGGFAEAKRINSLSLDPTAFPNAATLKNNNNLGRLNVTTSMGDIDNDGDYDELYTFGSRSVTIRDLAGNIIWDSGDFLEQLTYSKFPNNFNASNTNNTKKNRSDDKGPEPEGIIIGEIFDSTYLFLGLERIGGVVVFNITDVYNPTFVDYVNSRDFTQVPGANSGGDLGPEGMLFIKAKDSPNDKNLLVVSNEISGSVAIYETDWACGKKDVSICYNGSPQCIKLNMLDHYLQLGAEFGNCSGLRIRNTNSPNTFSWNANYNVTSQSIDITLHSGHEENYVVMIFDMTGKSIFTEKINSTDAITILPAENLASGLYFARLEGQNFSETIKIVIP